MSDYCPHCDDFSIDSSRARRNLLKKKCSVGGSSGEKSKNMTVRPDRKSKGTEIADKK